MNTKPILLATFLALSVSGTAFAAGTTTTGSAGAAAKSDTANANTGNNTRNPAFDNESKIVGQPPAGTTGVAVNPRRCAINRINPR